MRLPINILIVFLSRIIYIIIYIHIYYIFIISLLYSYFLDVYLHFYEKKQIWMPYKQTRIIMNLYAKINLYGFFSNAWNALITWTFALTRHLSLNLQRQKIFKCWFKKTNAQETRLINENQTAQKWKCHNLVLFFFSMSHSLLKR